MTFTFTATAECDICGAYLSSSDEVCDHDGEDTDTYVFRRLGEGASSIRTVEATPAWLWGALKAEVGDEWLLYAYLGSVQMVETFKKYESLDDMKHLQLACDASERVIDA